ncbi:protein NRT1/ PTR FAMILY 4.6-like [Senna tora]|uniref:Protein NRT1/ PTR FAMILY 4.6-like n=1 Tax=Senna tora TaxID=362788 RepID=A0A834XJ56_9FABA|nr:protein NRT1/ PTR FAMILY 4.6-like [Senna tora]
MAAAVTGATGAAGDKVVVILVRDYTTSTNWCGFNAFCHFNGRSWGYRSQEKEQGRKDPFKPINLFWLCFQYAIFGIADMFTLEGLLEFFFYRESPGSMKSLATSFTWLLLKHYVCGYHKCSDRKYHTKKTRMVALGRDEKMEMMRKIKMICDGVCEAGEKPKEQRRPLFQRRTELLHAIPDHRRMPPPRLRPPQLLLVATPSVIAREK